MISRVVDAQFGKLEISRLEQERNSRMCQEGFVISYYIRRAYLRSVNRKHQLRHNGNLSVTKFVEVDIIWLLRTFYRACPFRE